jgi:hypothetical protein
VRFGKAAQLLVAITADSDCKFRTRLVHVNAFNCAQNTQICLNTYQKASKRFLNESSQNRTLNDDA